MRSSLSAKTAGEHVSLLPSRTETKVEMFISWSWSPQQLLLLLTFLGVGVGLDLQNHRGHHVSIHVCEWVGHPLRTETTAGYIWAPPLLSLGTSGPMLVC